MPYPTGVTPKAPTPPPPEMGLQPLPPPPKEFRETACSPVLELLPGDPVPVIQAPKGSKMAVLSKAIIRMSGAVKTAFGAAIFAEVRAIPTWGLGL